MNKNLIKIIIIIIAFAASGLVLYFGMFKDKASPVPSQLGVVGLGGVGAVGGEVPVDQEILPNGEKLDFKAAINEVRFKYNIAKYPTLNPSTEVGIDEQNLITPIIIVEEE